MIDTPPDDLQRFPDIMPDHFTKGHFYVIESADIDSREEFEKLLQLMHAFAERSFYYYCEKGNAFNKYLVVAEQTGVIIYRETKSFFYRHPRLKRDYVRIVKSPDGTYPFDWEREVVEKGPMFFETTLALSERERRRRDVADLARKPSEPSPVIFRPAIYGMGFDGPAVIKWFQSTRLGRWLKGTFSRP